jgi:16S rRNA (uracil1498-N3)-methyltransferase
MKEERFFYCPEVKTVSYLSEEEAAHALRVLRMLPGSTITLTDGRGGVYEAYITATTKRECHFTVIKETKKGHNWKGHLHLAVAPTKHMDRTEWLVEKATEIGFDEISFLNCQFSERRHINRERIEKIVISAMKQSHSAWKPQVNGPEEFDAFIRKRRSGRKYIAHCYDDIELCPKGKPFLPIALNCGEVTDETEDILIMIGPEGDFSIEEVKAAIDCGFVPVSLGNSRLRTETAGLVAVHLMNLHNRIDNDARDN